MTRNVAGLCAAVALLAVCGIAFAADSVDEIVAMAQKNVGEDVMLAVVEKSQANYTLSAAEIIKLKDAKVPDKVITAMLRHRPAAGPAVATTPAAPNPAPVAPAAPVVAAGKGALNIENLDDRVWSYRYEPDAQTIWIAPVAADGRGNIEAHGGISLRMPTGALKVRYNGQKDGQEITVFAEDKSLLMISRVDTADLEALYATTFEHGQRKSTGRLVTLRDNGQPNQRNSEAQPPVQERIVESPPTVIYQNPPVIYGGPYYYPRYYYGPSVRFGYSHFGHHSGWGVGFGF
ncbi:MAG TPA: hypothetical protein VGP72_06195 [Planctomycetota bacterium]|jgi:hypothetical protein